jgi:fatty acid desaturase
MTTPETDERSTMKDREAAVIRNGLTVALAVAVLVAAVAAWQTVHPLVGAGLALVATAAWWATVTKRQHEKDTAVAMAEGAARARGPVDTGFDGPVRPEAPWSGDR